MSEAEWLACTDTRLMENAVRDKGSERQWCLFACACCRLVWHLLPAPCYRLVEAVEQYADKETTPSDLAKLFEGYYPDQVAMSTAPGGNQAAEAVGYLGWRWRWGTKGTDWQVWYISCRVSRSAAESLAKSVAWQKARQLEGEFLHDIFGPEVFRPLALDLALAAWNGDRIATLAQSIYDERAFDGLPILADALEEAGCTDQDILNHCRGPGPHVRGCWVVDLILSKRPLERIKLRNGS